MKILMITPYITLKGHPEFVRNQTGFGYMVYDIARAVAKTEEVDLLASDTRGAGFISDNINILKRSWWVFVLHIFQCLPLASVFGLIMNYSEMHRVTKLRLFYYLLISGYFCNVLRKRHYDVIHIHGCGFASELWIQVCQKYHYKFVVTLHGLNSFSDTVKLEPAGKQYERDFLKRVTKGEFPITVISTGIKRLIESTYGVKDCKGITVVCNSFNFSQREKYKDIRTQYYIPNDAKVILYVGNISKNKNQLQMVRAFNLLPNNIQEKTWVLFCGEDHSKDGALQKLIGNTPNSDHLILCGVVDKAEMGCYYQEADGVVLLSHSEGFGLSLVEGMHFGLPCAMPTNLDAFEDIYSPCSVVDIESRDDQSVAKSIEQLLVKKWDKNSIMEYSQRFASKTMAENYLKVYSSLFQK